jgi:hypothetical protein
MAEYSIAIIKNYFAETEITKDKDAVGKEIRKILNDPNVRAIMIVKIPSTTKG